MRRFLLLFVLLLASALAYAAPARIYSVKLTWVASTSSTVVQYRIYRGTSSGAETVLTTVGNVLTYTDSPISVGTTYYYQVSSINANAQEGSRSTEISVQVASVTLSGNVVLGGHIGVVFTSPTPPPLPASCGAPTYNCARTDLVAAPTPNPPPNAGNLTGAGTCFNDPDFGSKICRVTDQAIFGNGTIMVGEGGSGDSNVFNLDSTKLVLTNTGGNQVFVNFNPLTMAVSKMYGGWTTTDSITWSRSNKDIVYGLGPNAANHGGQYRSYDTSSPSIPIPTVAADFLVGAGSLPSNGGCLGAGFNVTWNSDGGVNPPGTIFAGGFSNNGGQGGPGAIYVAVITPNGCQVLNTLTGVITSSGSLPNGTVPNWTTVTDPNGFTIHNVRSAKDSSYIRITPTGLVGAQSMFFWQTGTLNVVRVSNSADGHEISGTSHWFNAKSGGQWSSRLWSDPATVRTLIPPSLLPAGLVSQFDRHCGYFNSDPADTYPFVCSNYSTNIPVPNVAWYNEIIGVFPPTGKVARFAHTFSTYHNQRFNTKYAVGAMSQDGRFFAWSTDWLGTLGSEAGASTCLIDGGQWVGSTSYALNAKINANGNSGASNNFKVTTAGLSGSTIPVWSTVPLNGTIQDGTVVWTNVGLGTCRGDVFVVDMETIH